MNTNLFHHQTIDSIKGFKICIYIGYCLHEVCIFGTKYSKMDQVKFFKGCLPQILLVPFLDTLSQFLHTNFSLYRWHIFHEECLFQMKHPGDVFLFFIEKSEICNFADDNTLYSCDRNLLRKSYI